MCTALRLNPLRGIIFQPNNLSNNCSSVVLTKHLQYPDVHQLWGDLYGQDLPDEPLQLWQIEDMIHRTGWVFRKSIYISDPKRCAYKKLNDDYKVTTSGFMCVVAYVRNGVGHVFAAVGPPFDTQFTCYQESTEGVDRTHEVKQADSIVLFSLKCPQDSPEFIEWLDRTYWTMYERRKKKDWKLELRVLESLDRRTQHSIYEDLMDFEAYVDDLVTVSLLAVEDSETL